MVISQAEAADSILTAARFFHERGWLLGTCGNLSVKLSETPPRILVTPSGRDKSRLSSEDLLLLEGDNRTPGASAELDVHLGIYTGTSARAVYHVHTVPNNLASHLHEGAVVFEGIEMVKGLEGKTLHDRVELPIAENSDDMGQLARQVEAAMRPGVPGVLVRRHGLYAWGDTPEAARRHVEIFEFMLDYVVRLRGLQ